jgi:uncharacterized protein YfaS (alpha-2-macroglobulin family)
MKTCRLLKRITRLLSPKTAPVLIGLLLLFSFIYSSGFSSRLPFLTQAREKETPKSLPEGNDKVLGQYNYWGENPRLYFSNLEGYSSGGVIPLASSDEPAISVEGYNVSDEVKIEIYKADEEALLDYLTHDEKNKQIKKNLDVSRFQYVATVDHQVVSEWGKGSKLLLPVEGTGIWFLRAKSNEVSSESLVIRSEVGALVKEGNDEFIFWGQNFKTRRSITEGEVRVYSLLNSPKVLSSAVFNQEGIATTPLSGEADIALVSLGEERAMIPINMHRLNYDYNYRSFQPKNKQARYFVLTDRPLYRPGDTVHFKAILRDDDDARYSIPKGTANVKIYRNWDEKNSIFEKSFQITSEGTIYGDYQLPDTVSTGSYHLQVSVPKVASSSDWWGSDTISFQVAFYRKPEHFINVEASSAEVINGDENTFKISGQYFSGQPLSDQQVSYKIYASDFYEYSYLASQSYALDDSYRYRYWYGTEVEGGSVILDEKGEAEVKLKLKIPSQRNRSQVFSMEATLDDSFGNTSFARKNVLVYQGDYSIYRKNYTYGSSVGQTLSLPLVLVPRLGGKVDSVSLTASVRREEWVSYLEPGQKYPSYQKEEEDLPNLFAQTDSSGNATFTLTASKSGSYKFSVSGNDSLGNKVSREFYFWVAKENKPYYFGNQNSGLTISTDKEQYLPGEKAKFSLSSDLADRDVFLSLERDQVHRYQVVRLNGYTGEVEVTLLETDMPNVFAEAASFSETAFNHHEVKVIVSTESRKLILSLTPSQKVFGPGDNVEIQVKTTDLYGNPVSAEVAVWVVDKALFELTDSGLGKIFDRFWSERYNNTQWAHSLEGIIVPVAEGGGGGDGEGISDRDHFSDAPYWNPSVKTNALGQAKVSFKLPDNLTTWLISAVGANSETMVGQTVEEVRVTKDLVVRPILPNILREGDELTLSALVHNFTESDHVFDVDLRFDSGEVRNATYSGVLIKSKERQQFYWPVLPNKENEKAKMTFSARAKDDPKVADTITQEIPVWAFGYNDRKAQVSEGDKIFSFSLASDSHPGKSKVTLSLAPTLLGTLPKAMEYLVDYPYGCVEQTTSRFVPAIIAKANPELFAQVLEGKDLDEMIRKGVQRLSTLQHSDGGWSWWSSGNPDSFVTAYVVEYLLEAKKVGISVEEGILSRAQRYLERDRYYDYSIKDNREYKDEEKVVRAYALTLLGSEKGKWKLAEVSNISTDTLAYEVMKNILNGDKNPSTNYLSELLSRAKTQGEGIYWEKGPRERFGSENATTALALRAVILSGQEREMAVKAARSLSQNRKSSYWSNTFSTVQAIRAVVDFAKTGKETTPSYTYKVLLDEKEIGQGKVNSPKQMIEDIIIKADQIKPNGSKITIAKSGEGQIYSTLIVDDFLTNRDSPPVSQGLEIRREYLSEKGWGYSLTVGEVVTVRLVVSGLETEENYGVVEDQLPAGLVPINESFKNEQSDQRVYNYYYSYGISDREITQNGVVLSLYRLGPGEHVYTYRARVISAGNFLVPPAIASLMYSPEVYARTQPRVLRVTSESEFVPEEMGYEDNSPEVKKYYEGDSSQLILIVVAVLAGLIALMILLNKKGVINLTKVKKWFGKRSAKETVESPKNSPP